jgi:predicted alpha-1,2-mannosidase
MRKLFILYAILFLIPLSLLAQKMEVEYVNSYIGSARNKDGGLLPATGPPFAMTNFSAQTVENAINTMPYFYEDKQIIGFIATHQPTLWMGDYGYVSIMPQIGELKTLPKDRQLNFSHAEEKVSPYYYSVNLKTKEDKIIKTEMASSSRCGIFQFTFPSAKEARFIVQALNIKEPKDEGESRLNSYQQRIDAITAYIHIDMKRNEITGYNPDRASYSLEKSLPNFKGYFIIQFDKPIQSYGTWNNDTVFKSLASLKGKKRLGAYVNFNTQSGEQIKVKIASSFISLDQARENLQREIPEWDFNKVVTQTKSVWQQSLEKFKTPGATDEQKTNFYTAIYHCSMYPREFSEYGRYYSAGDDQIHKGVSYNDYSLWDTYRALHPFLIFSQPQRVNDMITAMLNMYKESGWLPMWPNPAETNIMIGTHADAVIADAYIKGFRGFDVNTAYQAMRKNAFVPTPCDLTSGGSNDRQIWTCFEGRAGLNYYHSIGYVPSDKKSESVSRTIEYGVDDYATAQLAKSLHKTADYDSLMKWSRNYKHLYNVKTGFMAPRLMNGTWTKNPKEGFTEGSPWTYLFGATQDIPGLVSLMGGEAQFAARLDSNFIGNHYMHDNEPGHHYIYLYDYCGQPWKTQELIRKHTRLNYQNLPNGINGNDDCGQMSAWYLFSVMGFYPVTPGSGVYAIGAPQLPAITINYTVNGKAASFSIVAKNLSEENKYVQKVMLDGKTLERPFISHDQIVNNKVLVFEMGAKPNYNWH